MKLEMDRKEVEAVLLAYAEKHWPGCFDEVAGASYHSIGGVVFNKSEPKAEEPLRAVA